jgi:NAD(P)-dependent dehydrogenase (short-subunit alcohol dehydrogenase family)
LFDLSGRVALISGASRGIGEAIARTLASHGAHVIISSRKADDCGRVASEIEAEGHSAEAFPCHVGDMDQIAAIIAHVRERHGRIDILVNNAAASPYFGPILDTPLEAFEKTCEVNLRGYFFMSAEAGKLMKENGSGVILNTASINGLRPPPLQGIYSITKAAIINMTRAFARECGPMGIRVKALLPGLTKTKFAIALFENEKFYNNLIEGIPLRRHAEPDDMAGAALFLVSDAGRYTTGECLVVDGGMTI